MTLCKHFGSKEALFIEVVKDSLDAPLGGTLVAAIDELTESEDLHAALTAAARAWVDGVRTNPDVLTMRNVVAR